MKLRLPARARKRSRKAAITAVLYAHARKARTARYHFCTAVRGLNVDNGRIVTND